MKYVIIGNSSAAVGAIEGIRLIDKEGEIAVYSKEKYHTYSRPLISYYLNGKSDIERMKYRNDDFYEVNKVVFHAGIEVKSINKEKKFIELDTEEKVEYDKLMIATGSSPFVPKFNGIETVAKVHTFYTLDDALELEKELSKDKKVLIIGAGLIGLKCAEGVLNKVKNIKVVDKSYKILSSILDDEGSEIVKEFLVSKGLEFKLSAELTHFDTNKAFYQDGSCDEFDILVVAIGVRSNISLAKDAGIATNMGIIVDKHLQTNHKDIYSAGDCSEGYDMLLEKERVLALLPNAYMQGEVAGKNMADKKEEYTTGMPMNAIGFFGLHLLSAGIYEGESRVKRTAKTYKRLFFDNNYLKGFIIIGDCGRAGIYTSIIREKIPLSEVDFKLIADKPQLIALNKKLLYKKLGGKL